jgi:hypothetical protein
MIPLFKLMQTTIFYARAEAVEREKNHVPHDTDDQEFSLGGEDAPFQESED